MENELVPESFLHCVSTGTIAGGQITENILRRCAAMARGKYLVTCPDLVENMDTLSSLRGAQTLCFDLVDRPEWVEEKIREINDVWFAAYQRIYDLIKLDDGSSAFGAFYIWGPGKIAKVQCDASAMFSPKMYRRFVLPALTAQCGWLDHSLYHLDGTQALIHLDALLEIAPLDAIEWTPQAGIETGGNKRWYALYRRILSAENPCRWSMLSRTKWCRCSMPLATRVFTSSSSLKTSRRSSNCSSASGDITNEI